MDLYFWFNAVATSALLTYNILQYREKKLILGGVSQAAIRHFKEKRRKGSVNILSKVGFWVIIETLIISAGQYLSGGYFNNAFGDLFDTGANYFGLIFFAPLLVVALCVLLKIDPLAQLDLITPAYPLALFFSKVGCFFGCCCRGIPWEKGFYNPISKVVEFPAQLLEAAVALALFVALFICRKKVKKGTLFPVYLVSYSAIRFFTEFLRVEPEVFMGLKTYQILCLVGVIAGIIEYLAVCKYNAWDRRSTNRNHSNLNVGKIG